MLEQGSDRVSDWRGRIRSRAVDRNLAASRRDSVCV